LKGVANSFSTSASQRSSGKCGSRGGVDWTAPSRLSQTKLSPTRSFRR
jgi:hypothetical protein